MDARARALDKGAAGLRLGREEALALADDLRPDAIHALGRAARANREQRFGRRATWVRNLHVNPTNLCTGGCRFCAFAAREGDPRAYSLTLEVVLARVAAAAPREVHVTGGLHGSWNLARALELLRALRGRWPALSVKAFTAVEIDWFARQSGRETAAVLAELREAGLDGLPGGGAEVFSPRLRAQLCPDKIPAERWLGIHRQAHGLGLFSNATLLFGCGETPEERVDHLLALRELQDDTGGFSAFIPLPRHPVDGTPAPAPGTALAVTALARLVLDNIPHLKAYWPMLGLETAAAALSWGADDLDGMVGGERIVHAAGAATPADASAGLLVQTIAAGGYEAVERDGRFAPVPA